MYDAIIVGGGPAGLSAATILGRCRRSLLLCDDSHYRNDASLALHGFLSRDGIHPAELRRIGREQLERYDVDYRPLRVDAICPTQGGFAVTLEDGSDATGRKLLLSTGIQDIIPDVEGFRSFFGRGVFHSPYCDGWEVRDRRLSVYGNGKKAAEFALGLKTWSPDVVLCTDGPSGLKPADTAVLAQRNIHVLTGKIARLEGSQSGLERIIFADGSDLPVAAVFLNTGRNARCELATRLGCRLTAAGGIQTGISSETSVAGVYAAGDASDDTQLAVIAAAEGVRAAIAINRALQQDIGA